MKNLIMEITLNYDCSQCGSRHVFVAGRIDIGDSGSIFLQCPNCRCYNTLWMYAEVKKPLKDNQKMEIIRHNKPDESDRFIEKF